MEFRLSMKAQYLKLTDGREVRIMWNMNALGSFTRLTGKEMSDLTSVNVDTLRTIAWCSAVEGELADGRALGLDEMQFGRLIDMQGIVSFSEILTVQASGAAQKKSTPPGRSPLMFFRRKA